MMSSGFGLCVELSVMSWLGDRLICMGCGEFLVLMVMVWLDVLVLTSVLDIRFLLFLLLIMMRLWVSMLLICVEMLLVGW